MGGTQRTSAYPSSRFSRASFVMVLETQGSYELENTMDMPQRLIATITTVGVPVTDQERALGFYTETLGLQKQLDLSSDIWLSAPVRGCRGGSGFLVGALGSRAGKSRWRR
jgi:hypothetical protein